ARRAGGDDGRERGGDDCLRRGSGGARGRREPHRESRGGGRTRCGAARSATAHAGLAPGGAAAGGRGDGPARRAEANAGEPLRSGGAGDTKEATPRRVPGRSVGPGKVSAQEFRLQKDKVRVYALARELDMESKDLLDFCRQAGIDVKNQLSSLDPEQRDLIEA